MNSRPTGTRDHSVGEGEMASKLEDVIRHLLNRSNYLHEKRIQKLIFLADLYCLQTTGRRLVAANFKPYHYGVHSDDVSLALQSMEGLRVSADTSPDGTPTVVFLRPSKPYATPHLTAHDRKILDEALVAYSRLTNEQLAQIGKTTLLWESTEFGQLFDYELYLKDPASRLSPEMMKAFEAAERAVSRGKLKKYATVEEMWADAE